MTRFVGIALAFAVATAGVLLWPRAQSGADDTSTEATPTTMTEEEREALELLRKDKPLSARRIADEVLDADPDSMVGHYVVGRVLHGSEGSLARAIFHLGRAREAYEKRYRVHPRMPGVPWRFHQEILFHIQAVAQQMEEYDYQLEMLDYHDKLYRPKLVGEHAWPLMKLGRLDEAREVAQEAAGLVDPWQRSLGLNAMCAIENAGRDRVAAMTACRGAFEHSRKQDAKLPEVDAEHQSRLAVHAYNAALAARQAFEPDEAEKLALAGTKRLAFTTANPWRLLTGLYLDHGRGADAVAAMREMHRWRSRQPPELRDQDAAETDVQFATLLLVAGRTQTGLELVERAIDRPDRRGLTSTEPWQALGAHSLLRRALRRAHDEILAEKASYSGGGDGWMAGLDPRDGLRRWADDERIIGALDSDDRLVDTFRVFGEAGLTPVPVWLLGDLVDVLGPGVTAVVLRMAKQRDSSPGLEPYLEAIEVDIHYARGRYATAAQQAIDVIAALPPDEKLLLARVAAVGARAARERGDRALEVELLEQAYGFDRSTIRRLGMSLPVNVRSTGGDAGRAADLLRRSPRLRASDDGFEIEVTGTGESLSICLRTRVQAELMCTVVPAPPEDDEAEPEPLTPERIVELFHEQAFAMPLGLTGVDMSSLDGSTTVSEQATRERIEDVLGKAAGEN